MIPSTRAPDAGFRRILSTAAILLAATIPTHAAEDAPDLQGTWRLVESRDGKFGPTTAMHRGLAVTFEGQSYSHWSKGMFGPRTYHSGNYRLEGAGAIRDITFDEQSFNEDDVLDRRDCLRGIFKVEGDRLTLCLSQDRRPTEFAAPMGSTNSLEVYQRSPSDRFKLMGTWELVEGDPLKLIGPGPRDAAPKPATLRFRDDWFDFSGTLSPEECAGDDSGVFTLDEHQTPQAIDLRFLGGRYHQVNLLGLYQLDAKGRTLKLCLGKQRPAKFEDGPNSSLCVYRFKTRF